MYYNDYEDYMRSVLGYNMPHANSNMCDTDYYMARYMPNNIGTYQTEYSNYKMQSNIEDLYPNIYKVVNPIVLRVCRKNNRPITNDLIEELTTEVYNSIEADDINIVNINIETRDSNTKEINNRSETRENKLSQDKKESRGKEESRINKPNNPLLRDLIKILLLNGLFGNQNPSPRPPMRPPFPGPGIMPPPPPGGRPPMRPRYTEFDENSIEAEPQIGQNGIYGYDNFYRY